MRELTVVSLRLQGFEARGAGTLEGALKALREHRFAAIITNLHLEHDGDGERLCASAAELSDNAPLIFFSGDSHAAEVAKLYQAHYIRKPARLGEIGAYLRHIGIGAAAI